MSVPFYLFHSLPLKLSNKEMDFPFLPLKFSIKGMEDYYKIILFILYHSLAPNEVKNFTNLDKGK